MEKHARDDLQRTRPWSTRTDTVPLPPSRQQPVSRASDPADDEDEAIITRTQYAPEAGTLEPERYRERAEELAVKADNPPGQAGTRGGTPVDQSDFRTASTFAVETAHDALRQHNDFHLSDNSSPADSAAARNIKAELLRRHDSLIRDTHDA